MNQSSAFGIDTRRLGKQVDRAIFVELWTIIEVVDATRGEAQLVHKERRYMLCSDNA
jgi:hypothetical protein